MFAAVVLAARGVLWGGLPTAVAAVAFAAARALWGCLPSASAAVMLMAVIPLAHAADRAADAAADTAVPDTLYTVPPIVIEAPRISRAEYDVFKRSGFVAVLDLGERRDRVEDLSTVLSQMVGVRVRRYGGLGNLATMSIRGSSSNQVDVFLDGVPLNDAYMGVTNLGDLPLDGIERVEVYRGFTPPQLGSSAIGGAVNLTTENDARWRTASALPNVEARFSYGSFESTRGALSLWSRSGPVRIFAHGGHLASQGNFTFVDNRGTPENSDDDAEVERTNNDFDSWNALARASATAPVLGDVSLSYTYFRREGGVPGIGSHQSETARSKRERHTAHLLLEPAPLLSERLEIAARGFYHQANEKCNDPKGEIALTRQVTDNDFITVGGQLRSTLRTPRVPLELEMFLEGKNEEFHPESTLPVVKSGPDPRRSSRTAAVTGDLFLTPIGVVLSATGRWQRHTNEFYDPPRFPWLPPTPQGQITIENTSPQFGFRWLASSFVTVKGNWGRYYRQPTFVELFGNTGSVTGSADLEAEEGLNRDIGVVVSRESLWKAQRVFFEVVYLDNDVENLILLFPNSQFTLRPRNIGSARIYGWETSFSSMFGERFRLSGNYTYLNARDTGPIPYYNGNDLPSRPKHEVGVFTDLMLGPWKFTYEFHYIGENYLDPANHMQVPAREIHNLAVKRWLFGGGMSLSAEGRNLTDNQVSDVNGFPLPGRSVFVTLSYQP